MEFHRLTVKGRVGKYSGITIQGRRKVEAGIVLLGNDKNNVIAGDVLTYF